MGAKQIKRSVADTKAAFMAQLMSPVELDGDVFLKDVTRDENAIFHRLWIEAQAAGHAYQAATLARIFARFYDRSRADEAGKAEALAKNRPYGAATALMECPALSQRDVAQKRRVYRLCGHGGSRWMPTWDAAIEADLARLNAKRGK